MSNPIINGHDYSFASVEVRVDGQTFTGIKSISYSDQVERAKNYGTSSLVRGYTRGQYEGEGSLEFYASEWGNFLKALGNKPYLKRFSITVTYAEDGQPTVTDSLEGCRLKKRSRDHSEGNEGLTVKCDLDVQVIKMDNLDPI